MQNKTTLLKNKALKIILPLFVILGAWEILALIVKDSFFMPDVALTFSALVKIVTSKTFFKAVFTAFYRVISGLILGIIFGILIAALCHKFDLINTILSPIVSIMKATPVACIIVLLWIQLTNTDIVVFVVILMVLPIIWQNAYDGFKSIDKSLTEVADIFELSRIQRLKMLLIPSVIKYLLPAIVTSVGLAWKAEIAAEIMTSSNIGQLISDYRTVSYENECVFAWTVVIVTLSIIFESLTKRVLGRLSNELKD